MSVARLVSVVQGWLRQQRSLVGASEVRLRLFALCGFAKVKFANNNGQLETKGGLREGLLVRAALCLYCRQHYLDGMRLRP